MQLRLFLLVLGLSLSSFLQGQSIALADNYFDQGDYEKARLTYQKVLKKKSNSQNAAAAQLGIIQSYQQQQKYQEAHEFIISQLTHPHFKHEVAVEKGYNYQLWKKDSLAQKSYAEALALVENRPITAYKIGAAFERHSLLQQAVKTYETAFALNPKYNFGFKLPRLYGELGNTVLMFDSYLDLILSRPSYLAPAQRNFGQFITDDPQNIANIEFKKILIKRLQKEPNVLYNELLSWLYIQQNDLKKALVQVKAIAKRKDGDLQGVFDLAQIAVDTQNWNVATNAFTYIINSEPTASELIEAQQELLKIKIKSASSKEEFTLITETYEKLLAQFGFVNQTVNLQKDYAHFLAFNLKEIDAAKAILNKGLKAQLGKFNEARLKMELADILVLNEKFNKALIYYSQIQRKVKSSTVAQEARFKVAKTSYYKGDFKWAATQLKVLKSSATQLIANDALELLLIIDDNSQEDSTQAGLKKYAKADLLLYQNKKEEALAVYSDLVQTHKGETIEDEALLAQAKLFEEKAQYTKAAKNYKLIIEFFGEEVFADNAYYKLAVLYEEKLNEPEKAKAHYEKIIFDFADSIYYVAAQKSFRRLRGDTIN